jgi:hypothetical protein
VAYNFETGSNKIKLLTEYESATQRVLLFIEPILQTAEQLQHARIHFVVSGLKIIGHENPDDNLQTYCISIK